MTHASAMVADTPAQSPRRVRVDLGSRGYDILIGAGLLQEAASRIAAVTPKARTVIVTDANVARHHLAGLDASLSAAGMRAGAPIVLEAGEATKSFDHLIRVCDALLDARLERGDVVIALGGGVIGDLAGFAASVVKRGLNLVQIPTTLLAQVDSSVGGKTGINTRHGKNLIGTFHQPVLVLADIDTLATLDAREFAAGYAEVVKYGLLGDPGFFAWLEENSRAIFARDAAALGEAIERSCRAKAAIVAEDERETGRRALLNLGHTFGHALEAWGGYSGRLIHGEAVAAGMVLAFELSEEIGQCPAGQAARVARHLADAGLPTSLRDVRRLVGEPLPPAAQFLDLMAQDKKVSGGLITLILARGIGDAFVSRDVAPETLDRFLRKRIAQSES